MFLNNTLSHGTVLRDELKQTRANVPCHIQQSTCEICMQQYDNNQHMRYVCNNQLWEKCSSRSSQENQKSELSIYPGLTA